MMGPDWQRPGPTAQQQVLFLLWSQYVGGQECKQFKHD